MFEIMQGFPDHILAVGGKGRMRRGLSRHADS